MDSRDRESPLEVLARAVLEAKANRENAEAELSRVPRWRFRRRQHLARRVARRKVQEERLLGWVRDPVEPPR